MKLKLYKGTEITNKKILTKLINRGKWRRYCVLDPDLTHREFLQTNGIVLMGK